MDREKFLEEIKLDVVEQPTSLIPLRKKKTRDSREQDDFKVEVTKCHPKKDTILSLRLIFLILPTFKLLVSVMMVVEMMNSFRDALRSSCSQYEPETGVVDSYVVTQV